MSRPIALITGGTSGIGLGVAKSLARDYDLALAYASNDEKAAQALLEVEALNSGAQIKIFKGVLATKADCDALYAKVCETFNGTPAVLVNSAGRLQDGLFLAADFEVYKSVLDEHLVATIALCQLALKGMSKNKFGRVVNLSSISSFYAKRGQSNYAAAKSGIEGFTRTVALEVAHRGITVNAIAPGLIQTPMTQELVNKLETQDGGVRKRIPAGRFGSPDEVGALVAFLCSANAGYITGTVIPIDGGRSLGDPLS